MHSLLHAPIPLRKIKTVRARMRDGLGARLSCTLRQSSIELRVLLGPENPYSCVAEFQAIPFTAIQGKVKVSAQEFMKIAASDDSSYIYKRIFVDNLRQLHFDFRNHTCFLQFKDHLHKKQIAQLVRTELDKYFIPLT